MPRNSESPATAGAKRCAFYARISPTPEKEFGHNYSIAGQLHEMAEYAREHGYFNDASLQFVDDNVSGKDLDRPQLDLLRELVRNRAIDVVLVVSTDRLSRRSVHTLILMEECRKHGVALEFVKEAFEDDNEGRLLLAVKGAINEYQREQILDKTRSGRRQRARENHPQTGTAPYGMSYKGKRDGSRGELVVNPAELPHLRRIFRLAGQGLSLRAIARELNEGGVPTRHKGQQIRVRKDHLKPGMPAVRVMTGLWGPEVIRQILVNPAYIGRFRSPAGTDPVACPALIEEAVFYAAQKRVERNRVEKVGRPSRLYLLRGMIFCTRCGARYTGAANGEYPLYYCGRRNARASSGEPRCYAPGVVQKGMEAAVWSAVWRAISDPQVLTAWMKEYYGGMASVEDSPRAQLENKLKRLEANERRAIQILEDGVTDYQHAKRRVEQVRADLLVARAELAASQRVAKMPGGNVVAAWVNETTAAGEPTAFEARRAILEQTGIRVRFERPAGAKRGGWAHIEGQVHLPQTMAAFSNESDTGAKNCPRQYNTLDNSFLPIPFKLKERVA